MHLSFLPPNYIDTNSENINASSIFQIPRMISNLLSGKKPFLKIVFQEFGKIVSEAEHQPPQMTSLKNPRIFEK